jgi:hypothetical protein
MMMARLKGKAWRIGARHAFPHLGAPWRKGCWTLRAEIGEHWTRPLWAPRRLERFGAHEQAGSGGEYPQGMPAEPAA